MLSCQFYSQVDLLNEVQENELNKNAAASFIESEQGGKEQGSFFLVNKEKL